VPRVEVRCPHAFPDTTGVKFKCLRHAAVAHWYISNRQIHEDLGVPLFADHIRALTASFDSDLAAVGIPLVRQLGRYLR